MKMKTLNDYFDRWYNGHGIFSAIAELNAGLEYINGENAVILDHAYHGNHAGDKISSALLDKMTATETITDEEAKKIAQSIIAVCKQNWDRLYLAFSEEYNPIWNIDGTEKITETHSGKDTNIDKIASKSTTDSYGEKVKNNEWGDTLETRNYGNSTETHNYGKSKETQSFGKQTTTENIGAKNTENSVMAFDSANYKKSNKTEDSAHINKNSTDQYENSIANDAKVDTIEATAKTDTVKTNAKTDIFTENAYTDTHTADGFNDEHSTEYGHTIVTENKRGGNIGVTMTQQLLTAEFQMREKYNFFEEIFKDLDKFLTIPYYNNVNC